MSRTAAAPVAKSAKRHRRRAPLLRARQHAHPRLGDDAERPLAAEQQPVGRRAGARRRQPPRRPHAGAGRDRAHRLDEVVDVGRPGGEVTAGARRDPAAERRQLERLRVEAQRQAVRGELLLEHRAARARLDARRPRDRVDLEHAVQATERERDRPFVPRAGDRLDAAGDARPAADRDHRHARARGPREHALDVGLLARVHDEVGGMRDLAAEAAHDVHVRAPEAEARAVVDGVGGDIGELRRDADARWRQLELLDGRPAARSPRHRSRGGRAAPAPPPAAARPRGASPRRSVASRRNVSWVA